MRKGRKGGRKKRRKEVGKEKGKGREGRREGEGGKEGKNEWIVKQMHGWVGQYMNKRKEERVDGWRWMDRRKKWKEGRRKSRYIDG